MLGMLEVLFCLMLQHFLGPINITLDPRKPKQPFSLGIFEQLCVQIWAVTMLLSGKPRPLYALNYMSICEDLSMSQPIRMIQPEVMT